VRVVVLIVGLILLILGAVLMFVPLLSDTASVTAVDPSDCTTGPDCSIAYNVYSASPSVTGGTSARLSWSSPIPATFTAVTCTNAVTGQPENLTPSELGRVCHGLVTVANTTGTSGSSTFSIPSDGSLMYFATTSGSAEPTVHATLTATEPLLGLVALLVGVLFTILGVVLRSRKPKLAAIASTGRP
jgi:hypothetical protein